MRSRTGKLISFVVVLIAVGACSGKSVPRLQKPPSWRVATPPILDIPGTRKDGRSQFDLAVGAVRFSNGNVAVADREYAVHFFDPSGRLLLSVGRQGGGPGEFKAVTSIMQCARDTAFVWDRSLGRLTLFSSTGMQIGLKDVPSVPGDNVPPPNLLTCSRDGHIALMSLDPTRFVSMNWKTGEGREGGLLSVIDRHGQVAISHMKLWFGEPRPLGRVTRIALGERQLYVTTNDSAYIDVYALTGRWLRALHIPSEAHHPTMREREVAARQLASQLAARADQKDIEARELRVPPPTLTPPFSGMWVDTANRLWIMTSTPGDTSTVLDVVGTGDQLVGQVTLPGNLSVYEVGNDQILGSLETARGEQHVVLYRVFEGSHQ